MIIVCTPFTPHGTMPRMTSKRRIVTIMTDFGEQDEYVGVKKGVILNILPDCQLIDISHQVKPQDIRQAAGFIDNAYPYFPPQTVHIVVVDPGVGSERRPIVLHTERGTFVAPDNGVLTLVHNHEKKPKAYLIDKPEYWLPSPSNTFHGRDIFSPIGAHLASGIAIEKLASPLKSINLFAEAELLVSPSMIKGEVLRVDRFGNALSNIALLRWVDELTIEIEHVTASKERSTMRFNSKTARVVCGWHTIDGIQHTYAESSAGEPLALVGSSGELEIAVNLGNAGERFAIQVGSPITIQLP